MQTGGEAVAYRGKQLAQLAGFEHEKATDERLDEWLSACEEDDELMGDGYSPEVVNVRETRRSFDKERKVPASLVKAYSEAQAMSKQAWSEARAEDDFGKFEPWLKKMVELCGERAKCWGWEDNGEAWDALGDEHEQGMTARMVSGVFEGLREKLVGFVGEIMEAMKNGRGPSNRFHEAEVPVKRQRGFVERVARGIGFDFDRGRLDESGHPFCLPLHRDDVRMTTRYAENMVNDALGSVLHEAGHGMYNQGVPGGEHVGTPYGDAMRLSVHESQSRMIENQVGRSEGFWRWCYPVLQEECGESVAGLSFEDVYEGANRVDASLIRVEADEATYNLHIMIRFELERAMMNGDLSPGELPGAWREKYKEYLGVEVPNDRVGCMQDIHWAQGALGYFPTYTLGNLLCAQFYEAAERELGGLNEQFANGEFGGLVAWLRDNIHRHGMAYRAEELCARVTGEGVEGGADALMRHLEGKLRPIYGV